MNFIFAVQFYHIQPILSIENGNFFVVFYKKITKKLQGNHYWDSVPIFFRNNEKTASKTVVSVRTQ